MGPKLGTQPVLVLGDCDSSARVDDATSVKRRRREPRHLDAGITQQRLSVLRLCKFDLES